MNSINYHNPPSSPRLIHPDHAMDRSILDDAASTMSASVAMSEAETELHDNRTLPVGGRDVSPVRGRPNFRFLPAATITSSRTPEQNQNRRSQQIPTMHASTVQQNRPRTSLTPVGTRTGLMPHEMLGNQHDDDKKKIRRTKSMDLAAAAVAATASSPITKTTNPQSKTLPPLFASTKPKNNSTSAISKTAVVPSPTSAANQGGNNSVVQSPPLLARRPMSLGVAPTSDQGGANSRRSVSATLSTTAFADNEELPTVNAQQESNKPDLQNDDDNNDTPEEPVWEEEATPQQTAFGKELLFARQDHKNLARRESSNADLDTSSEGVLSTASEMGTIVNNAARLAELDAELEREQEELLMNGETDEYAADYVRNTQNDNEIPELNDQYQNTELTFPELSDAKNNNPVSDTGGDHTDDGEMTRLRPRPLWSRDSSVGGMMPGDEEVAQEGRSLIMPGTAARTSTPASSPSVLSPSRLSMAVRKTMMNAAAHTRRTPPQPHYEDIQQEEDTGERDPEQQQQDVFYSEKNGEKERGNTEVDALSERTPPRIMAGRTAVVSIPQSYSWSEGEAIEVTLSPTNHGNGSHDGNESFRTDTARADSSHGSPSHESSDATPASFLLRSPGSSAFLAASNSHKKKSKKSLWRQHRERRSQEERENTSSPTPTSGNKLSRDLPFSSSASSISLSSSVVAPLSVSGKVSLQKPQNINWSTQKTFAVPIVDENEVLQDPAVFGSDVGVKTDKSSNRPAYEPDPLQQSLASPMRIERECFSFDDNISNLKRPSSFFSGTSSTSGALDQSENSNANGLSRASQAGSTHVMLGSENVSLSWDVASSTNTPFKSPSAAARQRLRERHEQAKRNSDPSNYTSAFAASGPAFHGRRASGPPTIPEYGANTEESMRLPLHQHSQLHLRTQRHPPPPPNDFSPLIPNQNMAEELKTPQRIEIEREDAIDILACLVERGVSLYQNPPSTSSSQTTVSTRNTAFTPDEKAPPPPPQNDRTAEISSTFSLQDMTRVVEGLKEIARSEADTVKRRTQILAIDELIKSHIYALEMSRAAKSACSWLKSIGRESVIEDDEYDQSEKKEEDNPRFAGKYDATATPRNSIELLTYKARLHAAEDQLAAKDIELQRLNEELAQCRAEIGRIRSAGHLAPFRSPNRSILDESEDVSYSDGEEDHGNDRSTVGKDAKDSMKESFPGTALFDDKEGQVIVYKKALEEANAMIEKLHRALQKSDVQEDDIPENPPCFVVDEANIDKNPSPGNKEEATVNVHMLDGENFITDWDDAPPLPPPPEHTLRSPIVQSVLEAWSTDEDLHESMLAWMEQVLTGVDPESIPPLTISNLDHQLKDGFSLHVLPLLLRRKDILVEMKTRVQRRTTYDLSISVDRPSVTGLDMRRHLETIAARSDVGASDSISVTHSATTTLMGNGRGAFGIDTSGSAQGNDGTNGPRTPRANVEDGIPNQQRLMYDEMAEDMEDPDGAHSTGLISALGGALGGFLTRKKKGLTASEGEYGIHNEGAVAGADNQTYDPSSMSPGNKPANAAAAAELDEEQPYHRVVSAPSGRIGVTFVEFRGHAMVSDVSPDSPLQGWIFPSDILIAIDELPVSGMRVRDIIQVLKDRMDRQRALRIISCHAMNDITDFSGGSTSPFFGEAET